MKTLTFKLLGLISSLLVTAGFLGAAEHLDPLTHSAAKHSTISAQMDPPADNCTKTCWYFEGAVKNAGDQES